METNMSEGLSAFEAYKNIIKTDKRPKKMVNGTKSKNRKSRKQIKLSHNSSKQSELKSPKKIFGDVPKKGNNNKKKLQNRITTSKPSETQTVLPLGGAVKRKIAPEKLNNGQEVNIMKLPKKQIQPVLPLGGSVKRKMAPEKLNHGQEVNIMKCAKNQTQSNSLQFGENSIENGKKLFTTLINPIEHDDFFNKKWEKCPLFIQRNSLNFYQDLLSINDLNSILMNERIEYTKNLDITSYVDGVRETHNLEGRAVPAVVWNFYESGCSLRLLNPQTFLPKIHRLNATLQEYFQCMVGANVYLTPPNSQGFAPHYDDIEAFVLQIEGEKRWKLYKPIKASDCLARESSKNFQASEIGKPIFDEILRPGDLLYFPRGTIHQAHTVNNKHSLHITLSVYQKHTYGDLLKYCLENGLETAMNTNIEYRRGLPLLTCQQMGAIYKNDDGDNSRNVECKKITHNVQKLFNNMLQYIDIDQAVDQMALRYQHDALPPVLNDTEIKRTVFGLTPNCNSVNGSIKNYTVNWTVDTKIRLLRANILRLVSHENGFRIYYNVDNSRQYHEYEMNYLEIDPDDVCLLSKLVKMYPKYIKVSEISDQGFEHNVNVCTDLWEIGLLITE